MFLGSSASVRGHLISHSASRRSRLGQPIPVGIDADSPLHLSRANGLFAAAISASSVPVVRRHPTSHLPVATLKRRWPLSVATEMRHRSNRHCGETAVVWPNLFLVI